MTVALDLAERPNPPRARDQLWTLVACEGCGRTFNIRPRAARRLRQDKRSAQCQFCVQGIVLEVTDEHRAFWLERFSREEIVEIAEASWGLRRRWGSEWRRGFVFLPSRLEEAA